MEKQSGGNLNWVFSQDSISSILGEDFWNDVSSVLPKRGPCIDVFQTDRDVHVVVEIPGIHTPEMVKVKLSNFKLIISGKIPYTYQISQEELLKNERFFGEFKREIELPGSIDPECEITAQYKNGIIEIKLPKALNTEEKYVPVQFGE
ncbi:MAG: Hsp20/alpha crystallin family protein [Bacillota bacterium]